MNILLAATITDGKAFTDQMGLDVQLIVPSGNHNVLRGLRPPEKVWRTPAYLDAPDATLENQVGILEAGR